jgi:hypothetical protein
VRITQEERGRVNEHALTFRRFNLEAPEHGGGERLFDGASLVRII